MLRITPQSGILGGTFLFITSISICTILVPLRMLELGFSLTQIGVVTATSAMISLLGQLPETDAQKPPQRFTVVLKNALFLLSASRTLQLAIFCAFIAAIPFALNGSFYPVYYVSLGYDERMVGTFSALLNIAVFITGMAFGYLNKRFHFRIIITISLLGTGLSMVFLAWSTTMFQLIPVIMLQGLVLGLATVMSVFLASEAAGAGERGITIGVMEMGFSGALFLIPLSFGFALERIEYGTAFLILGAFLISLGVLFKTAIRRSYIKAELR